jgi:hypothetical protein
MSMLVKECLAKHKIWRRCRVTQSLQTCDLPNFSCFRAWILLSTDVDSRPRRGHCKATTALTGIERRSPGTLAKPWRTVSLTKGMVSSGMLRRVALVRTDVNEDLSASFIRVTKIGERGTTSALNSNRRELRRNTKWQKEASMEFRIEDAEGSGGW